MKLYQYRGKIDPINYPDNKLSESYKGLNYLAALLEDGSMKFAPPSEFNDPFDCCPTFLSEPIPPGFPHAVGHEINRFIQSGMSTSSGVACFTTKPDNVLMWSHYGDQHQSVCVGFDADLLSDCTITNSKDYPIYHGLDKVIYTRDRPHEGREAYFHKAADWAYEEEYRLISSFKKGQPMWGPGVWTIPRESICEIILGAKMDDNLKRMVVSMVKTIRPDLPIKIAVLDMKTFDLHIEPLDSQPIVRKMSGYIMDANEQWQDV